MEKKLFTSESVAPGHPDKVCDYISDFILDSYLELDPNARVACETLVKDDTIVIAGEISSTATLDINKKIENIYDYFGYDIKPKIINLLNKQSDDIALGTNDTVGGAGDQGIMFGYANTETKYYMPLAISIANKLIEEVDTLRKNNNIEWVKPDMKSQVTIDYTGKPRVDTVLMSIQHDANYNETIFKNNIIRIIKNVVAFFGLNDDFKIMINPTGRFVIGGPIGDAGVTGRKIIVDTYGGYAPHGGGAFSGKDATKVDRSAAYMARYLAKNIVAAGICNECTIELAYAIGVKDPVSFNINTHDSKVDTQKLMCEIKKIVDLTPQGIIQRFDLRKPIYIKSTRYGHFGIPVKDGYEIPWEKLDLVPELKKIFNKN